MVEPVNPSLGVRLCTFDITDVVRLSVVVPGDNLNYIEFIALVDDVLPAGRVEMGVSVIDPLEVLDVSKCKSYNM